MNRQPIGSSSTVVTVVTIPAWQPIATAPKDGTLFDVWLGDADDVDVGFYCSHGTRRSVDWTWDQFTNLFRPTAGIFAASTILPVSVQPTHWRPRPGGPTS